MADNETVQGAVTSIDEARQLFAALSERCKTMVQGRDEVIKLVLTALFADGHVLLEDYPGSGKTTLAKALGDGIVRTKKSEHFEAFRRIQFTPDLLPSDVTGTSILDTTTGQFVFRPGPLFANIVLADEINRTSPKVQASLLEAMAEKQVTVDNKTHRLEDMFFVLATQNPLDLVGTYPLPQAQLDRFLFKVKMTYLVREREIEVLSRWRAAREAPPKVFVSPQGIVSARQVVAKAIHVGSVINEALVDIANALRSDPRVLLGVSTRSLVVALPALQVRAAMDGRDFVSPQDIKALAAPLFAHRLTLVPGNRELSSEAIATECTERVLDQITRASVKARPMAAQG